MLGVCSCHWSTTLIVMIWNQSFLWNRVKDPWKIDHCICRRFRNIHIVTASSHIFSLDRAESDIITIEESSRPVSWGKIESWTENVHSDLGYASKYLPQNDRPCATLNPTQNINHYNCTAFQNNMVSPTASIFLTWIILVIIFWAQLILRVF